MEKKIYQNLNNEDLLKKRNLVKGATIGFGIVALLAAVIVIYLYTTEGFKDVNIASLVPVSMLPIFFLPMLINSSLLNKEVKSRNL